MRKSLQYLSCGVIAALGMLLGLALPGFHDIGDIGPSSYDRAIKSAKATDAYAVLLPDHRTVVCVSVIPASGGAGISCDWEHAR